MFIVVVCYEGHFPLVTKYELYSEAYQHIEQLAKLEEAELRGIVHPVQSKEDPTTPLGEYVAEDKVADYIAFRAYVYEIKEDKYARI